MLCYRPKAAASCDLKEQFGSDDDGKGQVLLSTLPSTNRGQLPNADFGSTQFMIFIIIE